MYDAVWIGKQGAFSSTDFAGKLFNPKELCREMFNSKARPPCGHRVWVSPCFFAFVNISYKIDSFHRNGLLWGNIHRRSSSENYLKKQTSLQPSSAVFWFQKCHWKRQDRCRHMAVWRSQGFCVAFGNICKDCEGGEMCICKQSKVCLYTKETRDIISRGICSVNGFAVTIVALVISCLLKKAKKVTNDALL